MRILIVDDSAVFRTQIASCLEANGMTVAGSASNGRIALIKLEQMSVDLVILDMEMPELDGLSTLKEIRKKGLNVKVIIFSTKTTRGAEMALDALSAGADDVLAKPNFDEFQNFNSAQEAIKSILLPKVLQFAGQNPSSNHLKITPLDMNSSLGLEQSHRDRKKLNSFIPRYVAIASSTGGPNALELIFSTLKGPYKIPILIVQHMPAVFTNILAKRLKELTSANFKEAEEGEEIVAGTVYIAPGDFHMEVANAGKKLVIKLHQLPHRNSVRPCADYLFETISEKVGPNLLSIVLTGMGEDGAVGVKQVKEKGGAVIIQNKESCVVFGMPGKVYENNDYDAIYSPQEITQYLKGILL